MFLFARAGSAGGAARCSARRARAPFTLTAFEFFTDRCLARVLRHRKLRSPFAAPSTHYVLLEVEDADDDRARRVDGVGCSRRGLVDDGDARADRRSRRAELWALREGISESLSATGLAAQERRRAADRGARGLLRASSTRVVRGAVPGLGDLPVRPHRRRQPARQRDEARRRSTRPTSRARTNAADHDVVRRWCRSTHGSISAEHGIGLLKKPYLGYSRAPHELALLRALKQALDPAGIAQPRQDRCRRRGGRTAQYRMRVRMLVVERGDRLAHVVRDVLVEVHDQVADVRVGREHLALDVGVEVGDDAVDVAEHAGHVAVDVQDAVRAARSAAARPAGS